MTVPSLPRVTLDTNCVINLLDVHSATATSATDLMELMRLGLSQVIDIAVTTRVEDDLLKDKDPERKAEMLRMLGMLPVVGTIFRWDVTRWDRGDVWPRQRYGKTDPRNPACAFSGPFRDGQAARKQTE